MLRTTTNCWTEKDSRVPAVAVALTVFSSSHSASPSLTDTTRQISDRLPAFRAYRSPRLILLPKRGTTSGWCSSKTKPKRVCFLSFATSSPMACRSAGSAISAIFSSMRAICESDGGYPDKCLSIPRRTHTFASRDDQLLARRQILERGRTTSTASHQQ